jgi:hypothetical protein
MTVLEKELRNGNFALATRHFKGGGGWGLPVRHDSNAASRKVHPSLSICNSLSTPPQCRLTKINIGRHDHRPRRAPPVLSNQ